MSTTTAVVILAEAHGAGEVAGINLFIPAVYISLSTEAH